MRHPSIWMAALSLAAAIAPPTPAADRPSPAAQRVDAILARWERESGAVTQLDAAFRRKDTDHIFRRITEFDGRALLKAPDLAWLDLRSRDPNAPKLPIQERFISTGSEVVQYDGSVRQVLIYPMPKQDRPAALKNGPVLFLFRMKADDLKARFGVFLDGDSADSYRLRIVPRAAADRADFAEALVTLNKTTFLPSLLTLTSANGKQSQTFTFTAIKVNAPIDDAYFRRAVPAGWNVVVNPAPAPQPAMRPGRPVR